jgi:O-antigen/teichoic acid export membrane protein
LKALGRSELAAINTTAAATVNAVVNLALIPRYGIEGAALATTLSFVVLSVLPTVEVWYYTGVTIMSRRVIAPIIVAIPLTAIAVPTFQLVPRALLWVTGASAVFAFLYVITIAVVLGFAQEDVMVIRSIEDKYDVSLGPLDAVLRRYS